MLDGVVFGKGLRHILPNIRSVLDGGQTLSVNQAVEDALGDLDAEAGVTVTHETLVGADGAIVTGNAISRIFGLLGALSLIFTRQLDFALRPLDKGQIEADGGPVVDEFVRINLAGVKAKHLHGLREIVVDGVQM